MYSWKCKICGRDFLDRHPPADLTCDICKEGGIKYDGGKLRYDLIPVDALEELVKVYTVGAQKYGDRNWEKGMEWGRIFGAIQRHLWAFWKGEDHDPETGILHLSHACWGCMALIHYYNHQIGEDDRKK